MGRSETVKRVPLLPYLGEYELVANTFRTTLRHAEILQIDRIQNVFLWECYQLKRIQLEKKYGCTNERDLFHGTLPNNVDVICKDNFDFRLAGERVGTRLGQGTYFARDAKYSDSYASPDKQGSKCMFLAKVLCGKWCNGDGNYKRPPPVDPKRKHSDLYDCCVDDVDDPKIVCVFDQNQYYPHYLIKYK
ncbi:protein mono-ADP-ribosyltransferase PARP11-like [Saccostrea echinata]|uniref:protein mono-ADP-ribosyltransferase PARP11-like n=1 Tax=Saccostrea echinata TaxID=191078 RepID=UPI002A82E10E|nr:protein mono-ADP-ribosyltransferase PARP11-like [Saccostrea echinata]